MSPGAGADSKGFAAQPFALAKAALSSGLFRTALPAAALPDAGLPGGAPLPVTGLPEGAPVAPIEGLAVTMFEMPDKAAVACGLLDGAAMTGRLPVEASVPFGIRWLVEDTAVETANASETLLSTATAVAVPAAVTLAMDPGNPLTAMPMCFPVANVLLCSIAGSEKPSAGFTAGCQWSLEGGADETGGSGEGCFLNQPLALAGSAVAC